MDFVKMGIKAGKGAAKGAKVQNTLGLVACTIMAC